MIKKDDWRLQGQEEYLQGAKLSKKLYQRTSPNSDHEHCEFCSAKIMEDKAKEALTEGYTTEDNYYWVCGECFDDFKEMFNWSLA